jgi:hypothetical protein
MVEEVYNSQVHQKGIQQPELVIVEMMIVGVLVHSHEEA